MNNIIKQVQEACAAVCDKRYMGDNNREDMESQRCAALIRALDLSHLTGWQDISTAPKDGTEVLLWDGFKRITGRCLVEENPYFPGEYIERWVLLEGSDSCGDPTVYGQLLWHPLPPEPKDKQ